MPSKRARNTTSEQKIPEIWAQLHNHYQTIKNIPIKKHFTQNQSRFESFSLPFNENNREKMLFLDYSKINATQETFDLLQQLCTVREIDEWRRKIFAGDIVNTSENKPCGHIALRDPNKSEQENTPLSDMCLFAHKLRTGTLEDMAHQPISDVITVGIGGSRTGVEMAVRALKKYACHPAPRLHFISSIEAFNDIRHHINIKHTLFLISSKSFTTAETMSAFQYIRTCVEADVGEKKAYQHFVALTAEPDQARQAGIKKNRIFPFDNSIGGRFSIWGQTGLPLIILLGDHIRQFHAGAHHMDEHFHHAPLLKNMPVILALIGVWHRTICKFNARAILPYDERLRHFADHIRQIDMESNGKNTDIYGNPITIPTGVITLGTDAHDAQHTFMQAIHQGYHTIPCEFILAAREASPMTHAHCLAQSSALMNGNQHADRQKSCPGNRPSLTLLYPSLTPFQLGQLIALYEHRAIVEGWIWGNNPFDQWGVELGKKIAVTFETYIADEKKIPKNIDQPTRKLISVIKKFKAST